MISRRIFYCYLTLICSFGLLKAQDLDQLLEQNKYEMDLKKGVLSGAGYDWIEDKAKNSSFLLFGETHRVREIPLVVSAVYRQLFNQGYQYLALEMEPWMAQKLSSDSLLGRKSKVKGQVLKNPSAIAFSYNEELKMIAETGKQFSGKGTGQAIWGLDNAFGGEHLVRRLKSLAPNETAATYAKQVLKKARKSKDGHEYISEADQSEDFQKLRELYSPIKGSEEEQILDLLEISNRVFYNFRLAYSIKKDRMTAYANRKEREEWMKDQFLKQYRSAKEAGVSDPKVIFKFGGAHVEPGIAPNLVTTLGNFVREFAITQGTQATSIAIYCYNKKTCNQLESKELGPLARLVGDKITLFDFQSIREQVAGGDFPDMDGGLKRYILRNDALILIPNSKKARIGTIIKSRILNVF